MIFASVKVKTHLRLEGGSSNWSWGQKHKHPWNTHAEGVYLNEGEGAVGIELSDGESDRMDTDESLI